MINFPYQKTVGGDYFPLIDFTVYYKNKVVRTSALVDSGATISIFRSELAEQLEIEIEKGRRVYERIKGYVHKVKFKIAGKEFLCPIVFSREYLVSFNLLGRETFFKKFRIIFEEKKNSLKLE